MSVCDKTPFQTILSVSCTVVLYYVMCLACLFEVLFLHRVYKQAHVISSIKPPCLETLRKDVLASFAHGTYFVDSIMLTDTIVKQGAVFQENQAFPLSVRKYGKTNGGAYVF